MSTHHLHTPSPAAHGRKEKAERPGDTRPSRVARPNRRRTARGLGIVVASFLLLAPFARPAATVSTPFNGVRYTHRTQIVPRVLSIHILEIDPTADGIRFQATPQNGDDPGENTTQTTLAYVTAIGAQAGVNASFFFTSPYSPYVVNRGIIASDGDVYSEFGETDPNTGSADLTRPWPALNISADNIAQIVSRVSDIGTEVSPSISLYNAVSGSERIITDSVNTAGNVTYGSPSATNPRTAAGYKADGTIVIIVVDGRQSELSVGMMSTEVADLLLEYDVTDAVNWDGGGSSIMVLADPTPRTINSPSDGSPRSVSVSMALFADDAKTTVDCYVFADFVGGDYDTFAYAPTAASDTAGVLATSTSVATEGTDAHERGWYQRLTILDDSSVSTVTENPDGGWFVRHLSGATGSPDENVSRTAAGYIGFWARTSVSGIKTALALDDSETTIRSAQQDLTADGDWHLYEWSLDDATLWSGLVDDVMPESFTVDSILFFGPNADAVVDIDFVAHNAMGSLDDPYGTTPVELEADDGTGRLINISARSVAGTDDATLILGFVTTGGTSTDTKSVLIRGAGPSLAKFGIEDYLADPLLTVHNLGDSSIANNDNWGSVAGLSDVFSRLGAFSFDSESSLDAALLISLQNGQYTAHVTGADSQTGIALVEGYDADESYGEDTPRFCNMSVRSSVGSGNDILIVGFVISEGSRRVLIRAVGPTLADYGVEDVLADPELLLYSGSDCIDDNDDWGGTPTLAAAFDAVSAFSLPASSHDAALLIDLPAGSYTVHARGVDATTGVALVEVYEVP